MSTVDDNKNPSFLLKFLRERQGLDTLLKTSNVFTKISLQALFAYSLVLERMSGDLFLYEIAAIRFATHLRVLCSVPRLVLNNSIEFLKFIDETH